MKRRVLGVSLMIAVATGGGFALSTHRAGSAPALAGSESLAVPPTSAPQNNDMKAVYLRDCAVCHGQDATGTARGPSLAGVGRAAVYFWVSTGRMPLYGGLGRAARNPVQEPKPGEQLADPSAPVKRHPPAYPPDVISRLVDYVAGLHPGGPDIPAVNTQSGDLAVGGELFREQCAACHAWAGDGGALLHREAPSIHSDSDVQVAAAIRTGPANMPAFGPAAISDHDLNSVVKYVLYLNKPQDRGGNPLWHLGPVAEGGIAWVIGIGFLLLVVRWIGDRT